MTISVIIPIYNEEKTISDCLGALAKQTVPAEIIVVDDGSRDNTMSKVEAQMSKLKGFNVIILRQSHQGSGAARNLGASMASGEILVFVDADMTFAPDFLEKLTVPIIDGETKGTFTKDEYVANWDNVWAKCWNYNQRIGTKRRIPENYPATAPVFRAILKSEFEKVWGFDNIGFTDDWTLSRKLGYQAKVAEDALCYHRNPETLTEVYKQARWIGKNEFISGSLQRSLLNLARSSLPASILSGLWLSFRYQEPAMLVFKPIYNLAIVHSILGSFLGGEHYK